PGRSRVAREPDGDQLALPQPEGLLGRTKIRIVSSRRIAGRLRFVVVGRNRAYRVAPGDMPVKGTVVIDSPIARTGQCGEMLFPGPAPAPHCAFNAAGTVMKCRQGP